MPFRFGFGIESLGRLLLPRGECRYFARFFLPLLDQRRIAHDFDLPLKINEGHAPAETLFVKTAQLRLVTVMIGWSQQSSGRPLPCNAAEIALDWIIQSNVGGVKIIPEQAKGGVFETVSIRRDGVRFAQTKKRARVLRFYPDVIALRFLQKQPRQRINGIRHGPAFNLGGDVFKGGCLRKKMDVELRQHRRRQRFASRRKIAGTFPILAIERLALVSFSSITTVILLLVTPVTRRTRASLHAFGRPMGPFFSSFKSGMARRGPIFLHPRGKKFEVDQIDGLAG